MKNQEIFIIKTHKNSLIKVAIKLLCVVGYVPHLLQLAFVVSEGQPHGLYSQSALRVRVGVFKPLTNKKYSGIQNLDVR